MKDISDKDHELFILRMQIEIRLVNLGMDSRLRRRIVKAIARISNVHKLSVFAHGLDGHRKQMHEAA